MKYLGIIFGIILAGFGLLFFIFSNFIYGHVGWIDINTFQINIGLVTAFSVFIFLLGLVILLKNATGLFDAPSKTMFIIRKMAAFILLCNLLYVLFYAGLLGLFLWLTFFNVALIFCLYLLFTGHNGYLFGTFFFVLGLAYAGLPVFPGPFILMPEYLMLPDFSTGDFGTKMLLFHIAIVKSIVALSGCFILLDAFFKKMPRQV
ncbi:hypothetical protein D4R51_03630 [bacterium]|nr:MAG: hypothetical protein D4R51_03630 [bacterium]